MIIYYLYEAMESSLIWVEGSSVTHRWSLGSECTVSVRVWVPLCLTGAKYSPIVLWTWTWWNLCWGGLPALPWERLPNWQVVLIKLPTFSAQIECQTITESRALTASHRCLVLVCSLEQADWVQHLELSGRMGRFLPDLTSRRWHFLFYNEMRPREGRAQRCVDCAE